VDNRLISQLAYHLCRLDISECSPEFKQALTSSSFKKLANNFLKYRSELHEIA
jgi:hypothetical protein